MENNITVDECLDLLEKVNVEIDCDSELVESITTLLIRAGRVDPITD